MPSISSPRAGRSTSDPDGKILDVDSKVSPKTAGEDVVKKLESLKVRKVK